MAFRPPGIEVPPGAHPRLVELIERIAAGVGTEAPGEIYLGLDVNAYATELSRLFRPARRVVVVGLGLLSVLDGRQLAGVLAHELAHLHLGDAGRAPARAAKEGLLSLAHAAFEGNLASPLGYAARRGLEENQAETRAAEHAADEVAARLVGRDIYLDVLVRASVAAPLFQLFLQREVGPLLELGYRPSNLYEGFTAYLREAGRDPVARKLTGQLSGPTEQLDSHPALFDRMSRLQLVEDPDQDQARSGLPEPGEPSRALLDDHTAAERALTERWAAELPVRGALRVVPWADVGATVLRPWHEQQGRALAERVQASLAPDAATPTEAALALLSAVETAPLRDLAVKVVPGLTPPVLAGLPDEGVRELVGVSLGQLLALVLLERGFALDYGVGRPLRLHEEDGAGPEALEPVPLGVAAVGDVEVRGRIRRVLTA